MNWFDPPDKTQSILKRLKKGGQMSSPLVSPLFRVHRLNEDGMHRAIVIAERFDTLLVDLQHLCQDSREFSIVKTKLEEAAFFAKKAMANDPKNQADTL